MTITERGSQSAWYIKAMFEACRWQGLQSVRVNVEVEYGREVRLHRLRIKEKRHAIARILQHVRKDMCRSNNPKGMPWRAARTLADGTVMDEQAAEYLLAMGVAAGFVTIVPRKVESLDNWIQHFAIIEDALIDNWLAAEKRDKRAASLNPLPKRGPTNITEVDNAANL